MTANLRALTVCQPYAHLIATGQKFVENRTWFTHYREWLAIHAGLSTAWLKTYLGTLPDTMFFGSVIAVVRLAACFHISEVKRLNKASPWHRVKTHHETIGPYCWVFSRRVRLLHPLRCKGSLGLWTVPDDLYAAIMDDVATTTTPRWRAAFGLIRKDAGND